MVSTVVPQNADTTNIEEKISVFSEPKDINGIRGSQGPRIKNINRAKGVHLEKLVVCASICVATLFNRLLRIAHLTPQTK